MTRPSPKQAVRLVLLLALAGSLTACGTRTIELDAADAGNERLRQGAILFNDKCSGCHTLEATGSEGSAYKIRDRERVDGPNFNQRPEEKDAILYAIRNGGFSGAIMPENIVVGEEAELVAEYLEKYAGRDAEAPLGPDAGSGAGP